MTEEFKHKKKISAIHLHDKTNCSNTLIRFYNEDEQFVKNLNFYDPHIFNDYLDNNEICQKTSYKLFNIKNTSNKLNISSNSKASNGNSNHLSVLPRIDGSAKMSKNTTKDNSLLTNLSNKNNISISEDKPNISINLDFLNYQSTTKENTNKNVQRSENMNIESKLESRRKLLQEKLKELKDDHLEVIHELNFIQKEIESQTAEIEVLENYNKFVEGLGTSGTSNLKKVEIIKNLKKQNTDTKEILFFAASQLQKEVLQRDRDLQSLKFEIEQGKGLKEKLKQKINGIKENVKVFKEEMENIKNKLMLHYHTLLNEGKDTRQEGLVWIIKSIWNLGHNVIMSYMPNYLDEKCIDFLFSIAHKDYELQKMRNEIEEIKQKLKGNITQIKMRPANLKRKNSLKTLNFEPYNQQNIVYPEKYNVHNIEEGLNKRPSIDQETYIFMSKISDYEKTYDFYKSEIQKQKINEINRINKEFLTNDYCRRYGVNQQVLVSAICGEDNMSQEYSRMMREQKLYFDKIKLCQSYTNVTNNSLNLKI